MQNTVIGMGAMFTIIIGEKKRTITNNQKSLSSDAVAYALYGKMTISLVEIGRVWCKFHFSSNFCVDRLVIGVLVSGAIMRLLFQL